MFQVLAILHTAYTVHPWPISIAIDKNTDSRSQRFNFIYCHIHMRIGGTGEGAFERESHIRLHNLLIKVVLSILPGVD